MLRSLGGAVLFRSSCPSPSHGYPFWLLALTFRSSRPAFCGRLTSPVSHPMTRVRTNTSQERRLLRANADRCCVCKRSGLGVNFHHIDGNSANTIDQNLAVLCVQHHDQHHRPAAYDRAVNHLDLGSAEILRRKIAWEAFVAEAQNPEPSLLATITAYGSFDLIHSIELVVQWPNEDIGFVRAYHLREGTLDHLTDQLLQDLAELGPKIKVALVNGPQPVEHCSCCGIGVSLTMKPAVVAKITNPDWRTKSICSIYINPHQASLALVFSLADQELFSGSLHLCAKRFLHYSSEAIDEQIEIKNRPSVRAQATRVVEQLLKEWEPAHIFFGTGDEDAPTMLSSLDLPRVWERRAG